MRYDYHGNDFVRYPFPDGRHPRVYSLFENRQGDILIGSAGYGLYAVKHGTDRVVHEQEYSRRDSDDFFTHIYDDGRGNLWQSSHVSLFTRFARSGHRMVAHDYNSPVGAPVAFLPVATAVCCLYAWKVLSSTTIRPTRLALPTTTSAAIKVM